MTAPLYSTVPIVPDESTEQVESKLTVDVADSTLSLVDEVLDGYQARASRKDRASKTKAFRKACARITLPVIVFLIFAGLAVSAAILSIKAFDEYAPNLE